MKLTLFLGGAWVVIFVLWGIREYSDYRWTHQIVKRVKKAGL